MLLIWQGPADAIRSTQTARVRHTARRHGGGPAAWGARAAASAGGGRVPQRSLAQPSTSFTCTGLFRASMKPATLKAETLRSSSDGRRVIMIGCRHLRLIWWTAASP